ncbi:protein TANC2-like isoform X1 [Styela clava]
MKLKKFKYKKSRDMSKQTTKQSAEAPSIEDQALMTRLGLLLGDHRVSTVKTQTHIHPILSHHNHSNTISYASYERRKRAANYTTSPASTLSDKGIGSSVGSFDSEFRSNLSTLAESGISANRTGSLDSRTTDIVSHSRSDSGIPSHSRSSSEILYTDNTADVSKPRLAEQYEEKLWNVDPRRNNGNNQQFQTSTGFRPRIPSAGRIRRNGEKSTDPSRDRVNSASDVMKLPQLCLDSPPNSKEPSIHSSLSSSRSITPAASVCEIANYKLMKRSLSSQSNGTAIFDSEPLPPPPPPPPSGEYYEDNYRNDLPPPPPPPPIQDDIASNHSRASSSDRTLSNDIHCQQYREENNNFLHHSRVTGKPPINSRPGIGHPQQMTPQTLMIRSSAQQYAPGYDPRTPNMIQRLRASSGMVRSTPSPHDDPRLPMQNWPRHPDEVMIHNQLVSSMSAMELDRSSISHSRQSSSNSSYAGPQLWDEARPHSLSAPATNPIVQSLLHRPSASFDNSGFHRRVDSRSSTRSNERRQPLSNASSTSDMRSIRMGPAYRQSNTGLQSLQFDLPSVVTSEQKFVGREWLFGEITNLLNTANSKINKGVIIYGSEGTGKTAIIHHLETLSYHGNKKSGYAGSNTTLSKPEHESLHRVGSMNASSRSGSPRLHRHAINHSNNSSRTASPALGNSGNGNINNKPGSRSGSQTSLSGEEAQKRLSSQVVAFHYCQADNNTTCYVPEFLHSVAAQLVHAPQLTAYRELLLEEPNLQNLLSLRNCIQNPGHALVKAVLEPLAALRQARKLPRINLIILLDGLGEAEQHRPDHGYSIFTFLHRYLPDFPDFLKLVVTCRTQDKAVMEKVPLFELSIDLESNKTDVTRDLQSYICHRMAQSKYLSNLTLMGKPDAATTQKLLTTHLLSKCDGNMLYLRLTLDLIESGKLVPKSSGFKVIPVNVSEVFLLMCNLKFTNASSFVRVRDIMAIAIASLYPLKDEQIYQTLAAGYVANELSPEDFRHLIESVSTFLPLRYYDNRRSFIHSCFREWLIQHGNAEDNQMATYSSSKKFSVDPKRGHSLLATLLSRQPPARLNEHATLELAHHLLKARMFRGQSKTTGMNSNDLHAIWMAQCSGHLNESLATVRNLFFPNIKVSKLLLTSGANPNTRSQVLCDAPVICAAAHIGSIEFVELLLMHGANINMAATNGMTCLAYAAAAGHQIVVEILLRRKPRLDLVDKNGHSPLLHSISRDHIKVAVTLLTCDLYVSPEQRKFSALQALIAAATTGNRRLLEYLLDHPDPALHCDPDSVDPNRGESSLTAAASRGKVAICEYLIRERHASIELRNKDGMTPLMCAVKQNQWETTELILSMGAALEGADYAGRTPLVIAASGGNVGIAELLLSRGANVHSVDKEGLTALGWAASKGQLHCVRSLIERGSDVRHPDRHGRTPLDLAAFSGNEQVVDLLLNSGADFGQSNDNHNGTSALDRAVHSKNVPVATLLLKRGAVISGTTWKIAGDNPEMLAVLLEKNIEDANFLYKAEKFSEARDVYFSALTYMGEPIAPGKNVYESSTSLTHGTLGEFVSVLLLGLARCGRKLMDLEIAEIAATRALQLKPHWYEALYVRARVRRETSRLSAALRDIEEAEANAPPHNKKEIAKLLERIREEINKCGNRNSISESVENTLKIPGERHNGNSGPMRRPRVNSASNFSNSNNNNSRTSRSPSPSLVQHEFQGSHSYQPQSNLNQYHYQQDVRYPEHLPHLSRETNQSHDNIGDTRMNLVYQDGSRGQYQAQIPYQHRVPPSASAIHYDSVEFAPSAGTPTLQQHPYYNASLKPTTSNQSFAHNTNVPMSMPGPLSQRGTPSCRRTIATEL